MSNMNLNQVTLDAKDTRKSVDFYTQLGLELIVDSLPRYARLMCPGGGSTLSLHEVEGPVGKGIALYFECEDLDDKVKALQASGLEFTTEPVDQRWLWREAWLKDPDGHRICLYYAGENRTDPPWRIGKDA